MSDIFIISNLNPISFKLKTSLNANYTNQLLPDSWNSESYTQHPWFQPISNNTNIEFQFTTNRDIAKLNIYVINYDQTIIDIFDIHNRADIISIAKDLGSGLIAYNIKMPIYNDKKHAIRLTIDDITYPSLEYNSEWLVTETLSTKYKLLEYKCDCDNSGIVAPITFKLWIECELDSQSLSTTNEIYIGDNNSAEEVSNQVRIVYEMQLYSLIPKYYAETIANALKSKTKAINCQVFKLFEPCSMKWQERTNLFEFTAKFTDTEYGNYNALFSIAVNNGQNNKTNTYWTSDNNGTVVYQDNNESIAVIN